MPLTIYQLVYKFIVTVNVLVLNFALLMFTSRGGASPRDGPGWACPSTFARGCSWDWCRSV